MICSPRCLTPLVAIAVLAAAGLVAAEITAEKSDDGVTIAVDGQPFTKYLIRSGNKPILWPLIGPTGKPVTRAYPMAEGPDERRDHLHHRSLWFSHGSLNGCDFWHEAKSKGARIEHREFLEIESGKRAVVATANDWLAPDGKRQCEDQRRLTFGADGDARWIDFDITIRASDGSVKFGDTKEGTMSVRVAGTMKVDARKGGRIVNCDGLTDKAAWGKPAAWVDYHGPVDGETVGIAILNHPSSFRFPTCWHVRTYGLFAANPFGLRHFLGRTADGSHTLSPGEKLTLKYRVLLHRGDEKVGKVAEAFAAYSEREK